MILMHFIKRSRKEHLNAENCFTTSVLKLILIIQIGSLFIRTVFLLHQHNAIRSTVFWNSLLHFGACHSMLA